MYPHCASRSSNASNVIGPAKKISNRWRLASGRELLPTRYESSKATTNGTSTVPPAAIAFCNQVRTESALPLITARQRVGIEQPVHPKISRRGVTGCFRPLGKNGSMKRSSSLKPFCGSEMIGSSISCATRRTSTRSPEKWNSCGKRARNT